MTTIIIAFISAILGGFGIEVIKTIFLPKSKQADVATQIRDELRGDITSYKMELRQLQQQCDYIKKKYFQAIELLVKNDIDIPEKLFEPYKNDPTTADIK